MAQPARHALAPDETGASEGLARFGVFAFDLRTGELRKSGAPFKLQHRPSCVLALLVSRAGQLVTREEIQRQVWPEGTFVDFELSLNTCIRQIRVALGDDAERPRFVETMPRRGYRFIAPVERIGSEVIASTAASAGPGPTPSRFSRWAVAGMAAILGLVVGAVLAVALVTRPSVARRAAVTYERLTFRRGLVSSARFGPGGQVVYGASWSGDVPRFYASASADAPTQDLEALGDRVVGVSARGELAYLKGLTLSRGFLGGGAAQQILNGVGAADATSDGSQFAIARAGEEEVGIEFPIGMVLCRAIRPSHLRVSPDGKGVAFLEHPLAGDDRGLGAYVHGQRHKTLLSSGWASIEGLAWRPDSREIWFTASRSGSDSSLRGVDLQGHEREVMPGMGRLVLEDIAPDGRVLLVHGDSFSHLYLVTHLN